MYEPGVQGTSLSIVINRHTGDQGVHYLTQIQIALRAKTLDWHPGRNTDHHRELKPTTRPERMKSQADPDPPAPRTCLTSACRCRSCTHCSRCLRCCSATTSSSCCFSCRNSSRSWTRVAMSTSRSQRSSTPANRQAFSTDLRVFRRTNSPAPLLYAHFTSSF